MKNQPRWKQLWIAAALSSAAFGVSLSASAAPVGTVCPGLQQCAAAVSKVTGDRYIMDKKLKISAVSSVGLEFSRQNADLLFTQILSMNNLSRVRTGQKSTYTIYRTRDARDLNLDVYEAKFGKKPTLPETYDLVTLKYQAKHGDSVQEISRTLRSFMPVNSRIIPTSSGALFITDSAMNIRKLWPMIQQQDRKIPKGKKVAIRRKEPKSSEIELLNWKIEQLSRDLANMKNRK